MEIRLVKRIDHSTKTCQNSNKDTKIFIPVKENRTFTKKNWIRAEHNLLCEIFYIWLIYRSKKPTKSSDN